MMRGAGPARAMAGMLVAVAAVALGARFSLPVPGSDVPQSLQTLAVVLVGAFLGPWLGAGALLAYLAAGAAGLPVFADGSAGVRHLTGPTAGYLVGFVLAAWLVGWGVERARDRRIAIAFGAMLLGHLVVLAAGWARLRLDLGGHDALHAGVLPFLAGAVWKSAAGAAVVAAWQWGMDEAWSGALASDARMDGERR